VNHKLKILLYQGGQKVGEKNFLSFPGFSIGIIILFKR